jgi:hypothetical protein
MMVDIHIAIRSYKRAGSVKTLKVFPFASVWVPESQGDEYRQHYGDAVVTIPDNEDGNAGRKSNAILNHSPCPWTLILDDDITRFGCWEDGDHKDLDPNDLQWFIRHGFEMAAEMGVKLWGVNQRKDELCYHVYHPISLLNPILGPFNGHLEPELRYDGTVFLKDDYDFWLQNIYHHRRTLRFNKYHYVNALGVGTGGTTSIRTMALEREHIQLMQAKWGPKVFTPGGSAGGRSATGQNTLNSMIRIPIPGA